MASSVYMAEALVEMASGVGVGTLIVCAILFLPVDMRPAALCWYAEKVRGWFRG